MPKYIHHTNSVIDVEPVSLPQSWRNISGLDLASPEELAAFGWLPVVETKPKYKPNTEQLINPEIRVGDIVPANATSIKAVWTKATYTSPVPGQVTLLQARRALRAAGLIDAVNTVFASANSYVQDSWEYTDVLVRDSVLVVTFGETIGLTTKQIDDLFRAAEKL